MNTDKNFWDSIVKRSAVLNPVDRIAEVLFGLIMVLTFTGAISAASDGRDEVRDLLWAALGCNVAWGLVDAIMYLMNVVVERGHGLTVIRKIQGTENAAGNRATLRDEIQPLFSELLKDEEVDQMASRLKQTPKPTRLNLIYGKDLIAGLEIFLLVFLCTLPVALPFAFLKEVPVAMRTSNGVALVLLFAGGFMLAKYAGFRPVLTAMIYTAIGVSLVSLTMALGG